MTYAPDARSSSGRLTRRQAAAQYELTLARRHLIAPVRTQSREGEVPTADRSATHLGLTYRATEPSRSGIEDALDALVRAGLMTTWRCSPLAMSATSMGLGSRPMSCSSGRIPDRRDAPGRMVRVRWRGPPSHREPGAAPPRDRHNLGDVLDVDIGSPNFGDPTAAFIALPFVLNRALDATDVDPLDGANAHRPSGGQSLSSRRPRGLLEVTVTEAR
jgi:hypothetical protein